MAARPMAPVTLLRALLAWLDDAGFDRDDPEVSLVQVLDELRTDVVDRQLRRRSAGE